MERKGYLCAPFLSEYIWLVHSNQLSLQIISHNNKRMQIMKRFCYTILFLGLALTQGDARNKKDSLRNMIKFFETEIPKMEDLASECKVYVGNYRNAINSERLPYSVLYKSTLDEINIHSSYARIINKQMYPDDSYSLSATEDGYKLKILKPDEFWEYTKYLIIKTNKESQADSTDSVRKFIISNQLDLGQYIARKTPSQMACDKIRKVRRKTKSDKKYADILSDWLNELDKSLNVCYCLVGYKKELKEIGVLMSGLLSQNRIGFKKIDKSRFWKYDMRKIVELRIDSKHPKILTKQPMSSYRIEHKEDGESVLYITNPKLFWENSKYLVIQR